MAILQKLCSSSRESRARCTYLGINVKKMERFMKRQEERGMVSGDLSGSFGQS